MASTINIALGTLSYNFRWKTRCFSAIWLHLELSMQMPYNTQEVVERRREHVHQVGLPSKDLDLLANYNITTNSLSTRLVAHPKISTCWPTTTSTPTASPLPWPPEEGGPPTLNHPASQQGGGEEEKIPGRRSLGGMEECRVWGDPFWARTLVSSALWAVGGQGIGTSWIVRKGRVLKSKLSDCCNLLSVLDTALEAKVLANKDESKCLSLWLQ